MPTIPKPASRPPAERDVLADIRLALGHEPDLVLWRLSQGAGVLVPQRVMDRVVRALCSATHAAGLLDELDRLRFARQGMIQGAADLIGILRLRSASLRPAAGLSEVGRFFALEVKRPSAPGRPAGKTSEEQGQWLALVRSMGGFAAVVSSVDEARAALDRARAGALQ